MDHAVAVALCCYHTGTFVRPPALASGGEESGPPSGGPMNVSTLRSFAASDAARLMAVVVLPTPPF